MHSSPSQKWWRGSVRHQISLPRSDSSCSSSLPPPCPTLPPDAPTVSQLVCQVGCRHHLIILIPIEVFACRFTKTKLHIYM
uniref:Uncharacterized protein n=1 Tax=Physcomitrium patens TaxID=3218 RepID=A0A2K1KZZ6_PHYPA|nr:hypothetical protein PHYPA_002144 [Physcomitrium patens]